MDGVEKEIRPLVLEKGQIEAKLAAAAGNSDFSFLLDDCEDLTRIIDEIRDVSSKRKKKEHAAFETKVKFGRKMRRKAKDLNNFEQYLVREYDSKHITLEHGRKMVAIIKLLRSSSTDKAEREAKEFYGFREMGARLEIINDALSKKRAQIEREKRGVSAQLEGLEWLEREPAPDEEKAGRCEEKAQLGMKLAGILLGSLQSFKAMPVGGLLRKMRDEKLLGLGFPEIHAHDAESMESFLHKSGLESKSAGQLIEMAGQSESRLRHEGVDLAGFRQNVAARRAFLSAITSLQPTDFPAIKAGSPVLSYLSEISEDARKAAERLNELAKTAEEDEKEWARANRIAQKKAELAGVEKSALAGKLRELEALEGILDGKFEPEKQEEPKKAKGIVKSLLEFFGK